MSDALFQTFRADGSLQFHQDVEPYCAQGKGTVLTINTNGASPHYATNAASSALIPMDYDSDEIMALSLPGYAAARYADLNYNGQWYHIYHTTAPVNTMLTYYRFVKATTLNGSYEPYGLELFNAAGQRTFHSSMRPSVVVGNMSGLGTSFSNPVPGRTYASIIGNLSGHQRNFYDGTYDDVVNDKNQFLYRAWNGHSEGRLYGVSYEPSSFTLVQVPFNDTQLNTPSNTQPPDSEVFYRNIDNVLIVDVTGL